MMNGVDGCGECANCQVEDKSVRVLQAILRLFHANRLTVYHSHLFLRIDLTDIVQILLRCKS